MSDPNVYWGGGKGGTQIPLVNVAAAFNVDNTGATNAAPNLTTALAKLAASGQCGAFAPAGTYRLDTVVTVPANTTLRGAGIGKTVFRSTIAAGPSLNCAFLGTDAYGAAGTFAANVTLYTDTFQSTLTIPLFSWIECVAASASVLHVAIYQVVAVTGAGPTFTYTVDRAILRPFLLGDTIDLITTVLKDVDLGDFTMTGTGTRAIDLIGAVRSCVHDIVIDGSSGSYFGEGASFDTGGYDNEFRNVRVIGGGNGNTEHGLLHESAERGRIISCRTDQCWGNGQTIWDGYQCEILNPTATLCGSGVYVGGDSALTVGSSDSRIVAGACAGCTFSDYEIGRSVRTTLTNPQTSGAQSVGVYLNGFDTGIGRVIDATVTGGTIKDANIVSQLVTGGGIVLVNVDGVTLNGNLVEGAYSAGLNIKGAAVTRVSGNVGEIRNVVAAGGRQAGVLQQATGVTGKLVGLVVDGAQYGVQFDNGAVFSHFVVDQWGAYNCSTARVAVAEAGIVDGVFFKPDAAATVDVTDVRSVVCADTGPTTVTNPMLNAYDGQTVDYRANTSNTTINRANAYLVGGVSWVSLDAAQVGGATLGLIYSASLAGALERYRTNTNQ